MDAKEQLRANLARFDEVMAEATAYFRQQESRPAVDGTGWGGREVLAHLLFWHERHCQMLQAVLAGQAPSPLVRPLDELNAEAVASRHDQPVSAMVEELLALQPRLRRDFEALSDPNVMLRMRENGPELPAVERANFLGQHVKDHLAELRGSPRS